MGKAKRKDPAAVSLGRRGGKIGGKATSPAKTRAARRNAKLGGRPRTLPDIVRVVSGDFPPKDWLVLQEAMQGLPSGRYEITIARMPPGAALDSSSPISAG